jgi:hypothetical protein
MQKNQQIYRRVISFIIKVLVLLLGATYITSQWNRQDGEALINSWMQVMQAGSLVLLFLLMLLNWGIEAVKWQMLVKPVQPQSFFEALATVLSGVSVAIITPARLGEFAGRIVRLKPELRFQGFVCSVTGSISQLSVTLLAGISAFPFLIFRYTDFMNQYPPFLFYLLCFICLLSCLLILLFYFGLPVIEKRLLKYRLFKKSIKKLDVIKHYNFRTLLIILSLSILRYIIFTGQYFLMFHVLDLTVPLPDFLVLMNTVFLVSSFIPSFSLGEVFTRGSVLVWVFGLIFFPAEKLLTISFIIWLINLVLPGLAGYVFFTRARIFKQTPGRS